MNAVVTALGRWFATLKIFVMIQPWEQGLRVRLGKAMTVLPPGWHWKMPLIDVIYRQTVRLRTNSLSMQTLSTRDGAVVMVGAAVGYAVADIQRLYDTLHHAEDTLSQLAGSAIARHVFRSNRALLTPEALQADVSAEVSADFERFGLSQVDVRITDFTFTRALRLVMDQRWVSRHTDGLSTVGESEQPKDGAAGRSSPWLLVPLVSSSPKLGTTAA